MTEADSAEIVVVFVTRRSSGIGRRMESVLARLQVRERERVRILKVDADRRPDLLRGLPVRRSPRSASTWTRSR